MINNTEYLKSAIQLKYRFIKEAANAMGFKGSKEYQRFRNTILGASKDMQVIQALIKSIPKIDTNAIWGINRQLLKVQTK